MQVSTGHKPASHVLLKENFQRLESTIFNNELSSERFGEPNRSKPGAALEGHAATHAQTYGEAKVAASNRVSDVLPQTILPVHHPQKKKDKTKSITKMRPQAGNSQGSLPHQGQGPQHTAHGTRHSARGPKKGELTLHAMSARTNVPPGFNPRRTIATSWSGNGASWSTS